MNDLDRIIKKCIRENPRAQKQLYEMMSAKLFAVCLRYAKNQSDAQEFLQLGAIRIFQNLEKYQIGSAFFPWAKKVLVNEILNSFRKKNVLQESFDIEEAYDISDDGAATIEGNFTLQELKEYISRLPEKKRLIFNLHVVEGFNHVEIAESLHITIGTSKSQLAKAKGMIKEMITESAAFERK